MSDVVKAMAVTIGFCVALGAGGCAILAMATITCRLLGLPLN